MQWFVRLWRGTAGVACLLWLASAACADVIAEPGLSQAIDAQSPDIQWLLRRYSQPPPGDAPDPQALAPVLADLHPAAAEPQSWWSRFLSWLRHRLNTGPSSNAGWAQVLIDALRHTPRWVGKAIFYVGLAAISALVLVLLGREARILWLDSRHAGRSRRHVQAARAALAPPLTLQDIDSAPVRDRPLLLLRLLVQVLVNRQMLAGERALTHGELITRAGFGDAAQRARFARVVQLAEARQFAAESLFARLHPDSAIGAALDDGLVLYRQLAEQPATPP